jgi:DNA polymerase-3 subunit gamma/tau
MGNFVVSARKYRPTRFDEIVGQEHVSQTLKNALQSDHLAHAFLFCGPRGVGKTSCARILAKVLNCLNPTSDFEPCNTCKSCHSFKENTSFNITELDAASNNSVEHIRALIEQVRFQPQQGKYKIFIIDEVHMLSQQAFNAFLKTLEEPPAYAIFILATTEKHKIIPTILSRCQIFDFRRIQVTDTVEHLKEICKKEDIEAEESALHIIAQKADGALRDALSIFDRIIAFSGKKVTYSDVIRNLNILDYDYFFQMTEALISENTAVVLNTFDEILKKGFDADIFINGLSEHLRNLLVCMDPQTLQLLEVGEKLKKQYADQAALSSKTFLMTALNIANDCDIEFKMARNKRLHVEIALLKMTYIQRATQMTDMPVQSLEQATEKVEKKNPEAIIESPKAEATVKPEVGSEVGSGTEATTIEEVPPVIEEQMSEEKQPAEPTQPEAVLKSSPKYGVEKVDLNNLLAEVKGNGAEQEQKQDNTLELEKVQKSWDEYLMQVESDTLRITLKNAKLEVADKQITVTVGSRLAVDSIKMETDLIDHLRKQLKCKDLLLDLLIDESQKPEIAKPQKPLDAKGKFIKMRSLNPNIQELAKRFSLRPDED